MKIGFLDRFEQKIFERLVLGATIIVSLFLAILFVRENTLAVYDASGHLAAVESMRNFWPLPSGWNAKELLGWPQGIFYPSLFHYLATTISFLVGSSLAVKLTIAAALVVLPLSINEFSKSVIKDRNWSIILTVFLFALVLFIPDYLGVGVRGIFRVGLLASFFVIPLVFLFFAQIPKILDGKLVLPTFLLALIILSHIVAALVCVFLLVCVLLSNYLLRKPIQLVVISKTIALSLGLSLFFLLPFIFYREYASAVTPEISSLLVPNSICLLVSLFLLQRYKKTPEIILPILLASTILLVATVVDAVATRFFGFESVTHNFYFFRLQPFAFLFFLTALVGYLSKNVVFDKNLLKLATIILTTLTLIGIVIRNPAFVERAEVTLVKNQKVSGRFLESFRRLQTFPNYYDLQTRLNEANRGANWANGLFAESSINSSFVQSLIKSLNPEFYPEGEGVLLETKFIDTARIPSALNLLGINWLVNFEKEKNNTIATWEKSRETRYYNLKKVSSEEPFEITPLVLTPIKEDWDRKVEEWWLSKGGIKRLPYLASEGELKTNVLNGREKVDLIRSDSNGTKLVLKINAEKEVAVLAKISYFPAWKAFSNGQEVKIYRAAPNIMLFSAKGEVELKYQTPTVQKLGYLTSIFASIYLLILFLRKRRETRH